MAKFFTRETKKGVSCYAKYSHRGREYTRLIKGPDGEPQRNKALARLEFQRILAALAEGKAPHAESGKRIDDWAAEYLKFCAPPRNSKTTHEDKTQRVGYVVRWLKATYPQLVTLADLSPEHFEAYQVSRDVSPKTINADLRYVRHALNWAVDREWLAVSPLRRVKRLPEAQSPKKTLSQATIRAVFLKLPPVARAAWAFCSDTGVRPGEMFALKWEHLNVKGRKATYTQGKTGKVKTVWYSAETAKLIEAVPPKAETVFYGLKGQRLNRQSWRDTVYKAAHEAKVMGWGRREKGDGRKVILWGTPPNPYALRHTVTTDLLQEADIATVRDAMGHSNLAVTSIYAHSSEERIKAAFERLHKRRAKG